jgi:UPF0271 protein
LINIDCGEFPEHLAAQPELLQYADLANIACGGHAGDAESMRVTVEQCRALGVRVGAHPSYPDRANFGRAELAISPDELVESLCGQLDSLRQVTPDIHHVKPHGALYNAAARNPELAAVIAEATLRTLGPSVILVGLARSPMLQVFRSAGFPVYAEAFADRAYEPDGSLRSRSLPGALITDPAVALAQATRIAAEGWADTICVHSDTPHALGILKALRTAGVD